MSQFIHFANKLSVLEQQAAADLRGKLQTKTIEKGMQVLEYGTRCRKIFFVDEGLVKTCFNGAEKEFVMIFFPEHSMFTVLDSFIQQTPSRYGVLALERTTLTYIDQADLEELCGKYHSVETFFRKLVSLAAVNMMKRISEILEENATKRYDNFVKENSQLLQRISLGDLARYLGVTQVSLSRIRAQR